MKLICSSVAGLMLATSTWAADDAASILKTQQDKVSYAIGLDIGKSMKRQEMEVDTAVVARGMKDALSGTNPLLTEDEAKQVMTTFRAEAQTKRAAKRKEQAEKNKTEGAAFLAQNKGKEGVHSLPSGLQYKVLTAGKGEKPKTTDTVVTHYRGTLIDGTEFDSSYKRGQPATFPVTGVIKGWTEALQLMEVGSKWQLFIPSELAYGENGAGANIGPNATLLFDIELLSIQPSQTQTGAAGGQPVVSDIIKVPSAEELKKGAKIEVIKDPNAPKDAKPVEIKIEQK